MPLLPVVGRRGGAARVATLVWAGELLDALVDARRFARRRRLGRCRRPMRLANDSRRPWILWATAVALRRQAIRRAEPGLTEAEVERRLSHWLQDRPGAEHGDGPQPEQA